MWRMFRVLGPTDVELRYPHDIIRGFRVCTSHLVSVALYGRKTTPDLILRFLQRNIDCSSDYALPTYRRQSVDVSNKKALSVLTFNQVRSIEP
jgi:hypothetical protein